jgi:glycerol-3-phosphate acyltransferase PlsX
VLVADGFAGNVLLKFYESIMGFMHGLLTMEVQQNPEAKLDIDRLFRGFDYTDYGGAPLLGVNGVTIVCHGGSPPRAVMNAIRVAIQSVEMGVVAHIARAVSGADVSNGGEAEGA